MSRCFTIFTTVFHRILDFKNGAGFLSWPLFFLIPVSTSCKQKRAAGFFRNDNERSSLISMFTETVVYYSMKSVRRIFCGIVEKKLRALQTFHFRYSLFVLLRIDSNQIPSKA